jgi:hypothetical protein
VTAPAFSDGRDAAASGRGISPALVLFFLSPMTAELLTGSAPPAEFFQPVSLVVLCLLYGSGAILIRDLSLRWRKGWPTMVVLGVAYGIVEEGLMVKSFFDPTWMDLGPLGVYGRWGGVNWVWSLGLTVFHAVWSICIPILLVTLMFPRRAHEPWIGRRASRALAVLMAIDVAFGSLALTPYRPPAVPYALAVLAVIVLTLAARRMPRAFREQRPVGAAMDRRRGPAFFSAGLAGAVGFFVLIWAIPNTPVPPPVDIVLIVLLAVVVWLALRHSNAASRWDARRQLALASGAVAFFVLLAPLQQLDPARASETRGMALIGLSMALVLIWLGWRTRKLERDGVLPGALWCAATGETPPRAA